ncbi:hypothetical protein BHE90_017631 [Fusarium euwallaceae]|uniref:CRESS-DNA virus Rep endonuclease domain-containing protein n=1 Tax=Fusarium euwallaceae TaxID=1147111 RepID=A0A430KX10_9HYPO|nr:hypothetical protein BHE90_017631 [Fusarium euwallaceae]
MDDLFMEDVCPGDSGYETVLASLADANSELGEDAHSFLSKGRQVRPEEEGARGLNLKTDAVFVTYSRSQIEDPEDFHRGLVKALSSHLPKDKATGGSGTMQVFGCKELHEDGCPHYHVVIYFEPSVDWKDCRSYFYVTRNESDAEVVDTTAVHVKPRRRSDRTFLEKTQEYCEKGGVVFGERIDVEKGSRSRKAVWRNAVDASTAEEAETIIRRDAPKEYVVHHSSIQSFLHSFHRHRPARAHVHSFRVGKWNATGKMQKWRSANFPLKAGGRPTCLLLVGPAHCGKTEWSMSWGTPARLEGGWDLQELMRPGISHIVLNDIRWKSKEWEYLRQIVGCQEVATLSGKYMRQRTVRLGKPVIWTCNEDLSPLEDKELMKYLKQCGATIVKLRTRQKLYKLDVDVKEEEATE